MGFLVLCLLCLHISGFRMGINDLDVHPREGKWWWSCLPRQDRCQYDTNCCCPLVTTPRLAPLPAPSVSDHRCLWWTSLEPKTE